MEMKSKRNLRRRQTSAAQNITQGHKSCIQQKHCVKKQDSHHPKPKRKLRSPLKHLQCQALIEEKLNIIKLNNQGVSCGKVIKTRGWWMPCAHATHDAGI